MIISKVSQKIGKTCEIEMGLFYVIQFSAKPVLLLSVFKYSVKPRISAIVISFNFPLILTQVVGIYESPAGQTGYFVEHYRAGKP